MSTDEQFVLSHENAQPVTQPQSDTITTYRERIATQIGEEARSLKTIGDVGTVLQRMQEGVIISLHVEGTRRFWKRLTPEDLGLAVFGEEASQVLSEYFQLGQLSLLPTEKQLKKLPDTEREKFVSKEELATFEKNARNCLERYAFKSHWGWFVPATLYQEWKEKNAEYEAKFTALKERLLTNYDAIVAFVIADYRSLALETWRMVTVNKTILRQSRKEETISDAVIREVVALLLQGQGRDVFVANYLDCIRLAIRSKAEVERSFRYAVERSIIPLPSLLAKDLENADRLYQERAIRDTQVAAELERIEQERRIAEARTIDIERQERDRRYMLLQAERERLQQQLLVERDILADARRNKEQLMRQFYCDVVGQINDQLQAICQSVLDNLEAHEGTLRGPISRQLKKLVDQLEDLNFMQDQPIEEMIASIRDALPTATESEQAAKGLAKIDTTRLQTTLRQVHTQAKSVVIDLGMTPSVRRSRREEALTDGLLPVDTRAARPGELFVAGAQTTKRKRKEHPLS